MKCRHPLLPILAGLFPFLVGVVIGGAVAGSLLCLVGRVYPVEIAEPVRSPFDGFALWLMVGMPMLTVAATGWQLAALLLIWAAALRPLQARPAHLQYLLGGFAAATTATVLAVGRRYGMDDLKLLCGVTVPFLVASLLSVARDDEPD